MNTKCEQNSTCRKSVVVYSLEPSIKRLVGLLSRACIVAAMGLHCSCTWPAVQLHWAYIEVAAGLLS